MGSSRVTSTSILVMIPRSAPSGSTEPSGERPIEVAMEEALRPGRYISERAFFSVVNEFESVAARGDRSGHSVGRLASVLLPLLVNMEETARLACVIDQCTADHLSHAGYRTVEAAEALDESYPEQAARLWRRRSGHRDRGGETARRPRAGV